MKSGGRGNVLQREGSAIQSFSLFAMLDKTALIRYGCNSGRKSAAGQRQQHFLAPRL